MHDAVGTSSTGPILIAPDDAPTRVGAMCGACGAGRYLTNRSTPDRVRCVRCGNGRPAA